MRLLTIGKALPMGCRRIDGAKQYTDPAHMGASNFDKKNQQKIASWWWSQVALL
jgi:hypothetical protein